MDVSCPFLLTFSTFSTVKSAVVAAVLAGVSMLSVSAEPEQANMTNIQHKVAFFPPSFIV